MLNIITALAFPVVLATAGSNPVKPIPPADSSTVTLVVVQNDRSVPVTVFEQVANWEYKLGVVAPNGTASLAIPGATNAPSEIQFFVKPTRGLETATSPVKITRGERLGLVVGER